jgi:hypothetical protein
MTGADALAKSIVKSLACSIEQYKAQYRRPPERIFAELSALYALKMEPCCDIDKFGRVSFMGIPVAPIGRDGLEIYLCGERVEIHLRKEEEL